MRCLTFHHTFVVYTLLHVVDPDSPRYVTFYIVDYYVTVLCSDYDSVDLVTSCYRCYVDVTLLLHSTPLP